MSRRYCPLPISVLLLTVLAALTLGACSSGDSNPTTPPPPSPMPQPVGDLVAVAGAAGSVTLAWTVPAPGDKAAGEVRYDLRWAVPGAEDGAWSGWNLLPAPTTDTEAGLARQHMVTGLEAGAAHVFRLRCSSDGEQWSAVSNTVVATASETLDTTRPAPCPGVALWSASENALTVAWSPAADDSIYGQAAGYEIRYTAGILTESGWAAAPLWDGTVVANAEAGRWQATITGLDPMTDYQVGVRAVDDAGLLSGLGQPLAALTDTMNTWYVKVDGSGTQPTIGAAVMASGPGDVIVVAPGRYTWTNQGTGHPLYGLVFVPRGWTGFTLRSEAGPEATILDAEGQGNVMFIMGGVEEEGGEVIKQAITVDGFTLTGGSAMGVEAEIGTVPYAGGGLVFHLSNSVIRNCIITGNEATNGGGLWYGGVGSPLIENCVIENNYSPLGGGVMILNSSERVTLRGCTIRNNRSDSAGGGLFAYHILFTMEDCLVTGNRSERKGGGLSVSELHPTSRLAGVTVADNYGRQGSALRLTGETLLEVERTIFAFNVGSAAFNDSLSSGVAMGCSDIYGHPAGNNRPTVYQNLGGVFQADPRFCPDGGYGLEAASPCLPGARTDTQDCGGVIGARGAGCGG